MREYGDNTEESFKCGRCGRIKSTVLGGFGVSLGSPCDEPIEADYGKRCTGLFSRLESETPHKDCLK